MPQIPMGNFGQSVAQPQRATRAVADTGAAQALGQVAETVQGIALDQIATQTRQRLEDLEQEQSNQAATASLKFETALKTKQMEFASKVESGEIKPEDAERLWGDEVGALRVELISPLDSALGGRSGAKIANAVALQADRVSAASSLQISGSVLVAKRARYGAEAAGALDELGKQAAMPGESLDAVFSKADAVFPTMAQRAGMDPAKAAERLQNWKDGVRFSRARIDLIGSRRSLEALDTFTQRLESGDLAGTLDADKRTMLC